MLLNEYYIINDEVIYFPHENKLSPVGDDGQKISINAPVGRCLHLLIDNKGSVVSRDDFLEAVWNRNGSFVSQNTFYQNISLLRKSLKTAGLTEDVIVTVRRKGFALSKNVKVEAVPYSVPPSSLSLEQSSSLAGSSGKSSDLDLDSDSLLFSGPDIDEPSMFHERHEDMKRWRRLNCCLMKAYSEMKYVLITSAILLFFILQIVSIYLSVR